MASLNDGLLQLRRDERSFFEIEGSQRFDTVRLQAVSDNGLSRLSQYEHAIEWICSPDVLEDCLVAIESLLTSTSCHQYIAAQGGFADQVIIAVNEYASTFRS